MISAEDAQSIVLNLAEISSAGERFAIQSCILSPREDHWVVHSNSAAYVMSGKLEHCYVGAGAHLVNVVSGAVETVGSAQSWQEFLQDKYDLDAAAGAHYVIEPSFEREDKAALINLRQKLSCSMQHSIALLLPERRQWLTGRLRILRQAQGILRDKGIDTVIALRRDTLSAVALNESADHWDAIASLIRN